MFIRKTKTGTAADGSDKTSFRLVENSRDGAKVRQRTLLNLGRHFSIERDSWGLLCQRIEELLSGQASFGFETSTDASVEAEARRIAKRLLERSASSPDDSGRDYQTLDVDSATDLDVRTAGVEHAALEALSSLGLPRLLLELGFNRRQQRCALANIVGRMAAPASERETNRWMRRTSAIGEMLDVDFGAFSDMALYRASDKLLANRAPIERHLFERAADLFDFRPTITFYDLTNTYFEGEMKLMPDARHGRSKEKRSDCRLLTLALVVDASGFIVRSQLFPGNVSECRTLAQMIDALGAGDDAVVVMDRGIATDANLEWLRDNGRRYVVVSRESVRQFDPDEAQTIVTASRQKVSFHRQAVTQTDSGGGEYEEALLRCYSPERAGKEEGMIRRFMERLEEQLTKINDGLGRPGARRRLDYVERRIGRVQKQCSRVARHYRIEVHADESGERARSVSWRFEPVDGSMATHPGVYCIRSNILDWSAEDLWRTYALLTEVESVFRSLKSELGLRPVYHQKQHRADGHLFISVIAYQAAWTLRARLKANGRADSWTTIRNELRSITRTTTRFERQDGRALHVRKTASADAVQAEIYRAMGISAPPRNLRKTIFCPRAKPGAPPASE